MFWIDSIKVSCVLVKFISYFVFDCGSWWSLIQEEFDGNGYNQYKLESNTSLFRIFLALTSMLLFGKYTIPIYFFKIQFSYYAYDTPSSLSVNMQEWFKESDSDWIFQQVSFLSKKIKSVSHRLFCMLFTLCRICSYLWYALITSHHLMSNLYLLTNHKFQSKWQMIITHLLSNKFTAHWNHFWSHRPNKELDIILSACVYWSAYIFSWVLYKYIFKCYFELSVQERQFGVLALGRFIFGIGKSLYHLKQ